MPKSWNKQINLSALPLNAARQCGYFLSSFSKQKRNHTAPLQSVEKPVIIKSVTIKHIADTAWNTFLTDKELIFSWVYQCNCTDIDSSKKTPLTWDICTNMRTCSVKRPCINRSYYVQVVIRVQPTPRRGGGVSKERGSHEGENLRDRERGCQVPCPSLFGSFPR